jgi:hypothetical protein
MYRVAAASPGASATPSRFRHLFTTFAIAAALLAGISVARASVLITVNKSTQRLFVSVNGETRYSWPVSTARRGYNTPNGTYRPERLERKWYSRKYDWSPMPYSIFFDGGYAIHGSYEISYLGRPASHGCVRLHPSHAAVLFALVSRNRDDTRIVVTGERPDRRIYSARSARTERPRMVRRYYVYSQPRNPFEQLFAPPRSSDYSYYEDRRSRYR